MLTPTPGARVRQAAQVDDGLVVEEKLVVVDGPDEVDPVVEGGSLVRHRPWPFRPLVSR
jgi:hypothetical protein